MRKLAFLLLGLAIAGPALAATPIPTNTPTVTLAPTPEITPDFATGPACTWAPTPSAAKRGMGWSASEKPPFQYFNWLHRGTMQNLSWMDNRLSLLKGQVDGMNDSFAALEEWGNTKAAVMDAWAATTAATMALALVNRGQSFYIISTPGDGTWTVPSGIDRATVLLVGGGGGGGGGAGTSNGYGGGGGCSMTYSLTLTPGSVVNYHVGAGGPKGLGGGLYIPSNGGSGENTWFITSGSYYANAGGGGSKGGGYGAGAGGAVTTSSHIAYGVAGSNGSGRTLGGNGWNILEPPFTSEGDGGWGGDCGGGICGSGTDGYNGLIAIFY